MRIMSKKRAERPVEKRRRFGGAMVCRANLKAEAEVLQKITASRVNR
jgi:hypothetical protein